MSGLGEQLENLIKESVEECLGERDFNREVESALEEHDFSDTVKEIIRDEVNVEDAVEKAMNDFDFSDAIHESVKDYDWWEEIEVKAQDEIETAVDNARTELQSEIDQRFDSPEFKALVRAVVVSIIKDAVRDGWQSIKDMVTWPYRKVSAVWKRV